MSEPASSATSLVPLQDCKNVVPGTASSVKKRPKRGPGSRMYANFRSAVTSVLVYRQRSVLTVPGIATGALVTTVATTYIQGMRTLPVAPLHLWGTTIVFVGGALIAFAIGSLASMSSMLVSIAERQQEMSVRMIVGARRRDIRAQIVLEALLLSSIGAAMGTLSGLFIGFMLTSLLQVPFTIDSILLLLIFIVSVAIGGFCGIYPAQRAASLHPGLRVG